MIYPKSRNKLDTLYYPLQGGVRIGNQDKEIYHLGIFFSSAVIVISAVAMGPVVAMGPAVAMGPVVAIWPVVAMGPVVAIGPVVVANGNCRQSLSSLSATDDCVTVFAFPGCARTVPAKGLREATS